MKKKHPAKSLVRRFLILAAGAAAWSTLTAAPSPETVVWFKKPATEFVQATPLGNGRLGATVYGGVVDERIVLNDSGMWSGSPQDADRPDAYKALPEIRRLLLEGRNVEAEKLVNENFTCAGKGSGFGAGANVPYGCYQTLGNLRLHFLGEPKNASVSNYRRELNLEDAVARVTYTENGVRFTREYFVSAPDQAIVIRLTADKPHSLSFDASMDRPERFETVGAGSDELEMHGQLPDGHGGGGVKYSARLKAIPSGGKVSVSGNTLQVRDADSVLLLVTAATDIHTFAGRELDDAAKGALHDMNGAADKSFDALRSAHIADYHRFFKRVELHLGASTPEAAAVADQPTPERLRAFKAGAVDPDLVTLYFNFGRYLLISSSRPGGLPANLQGIWADSIQTPWNGDWHLNVNVQMNYWPAEVCDLPELTQPLFALISSLQAPGARTAKDYYNARGWVAHVITNPWGFTSPGESASWGGTSSGSAWLCEHLWDHYLFTRDREFLEWAYPIMKGSAQFYLDMLIKEPTHGWLVTAPSNSPENSFYMPDGKIAHICLGATCDEQLVRYLFTACIEASRILGVDADLRKELTEKRAKLAPTRIGPDGRVMEWQKEYKEVDPHHRHVAHLWGLYPGDQISPTRTPALAQAARKTLNVRGNGGTGWSLAFKVCLWARLGDGNRAYLLLQHHLKPATKETAKKRWSGGTYPNLFDAHPPFQIDGNFGGTAGIAEMLLQSEATPEAGGWTNEIHLLPALPDAWPSGSVRGFCTRGGFQVDLTWAHGKLSGATISSLHGHKVRVRYGDKITDIDLKPGQSVHLNGDLQLQ